MNTITLNDLSESLPEIRSDWNDEGVVILEDILPDNIIDDYSLEWSGANGFAGLDLDNRLIAERAGGWGDCTPYMRYPSLRALCCDGQIATALEGLMGEPAGVHLNLTGWVSTERDWHQDTYLNPPHVGDYYAAVWMALGDVDYASGPFQYVPGSHLWHVLTRDRIGSIVDLSDPEWPKHTETVLSPLVEAEIEARGGEVVTYLPKRGDVLIWHGRLYHRGSKATNPGTYRPALIAHYSGINHRQDMPRAVQTVQGGWLFPLQGTQPV